MSETNTPRHPQFNGRPIMIGDTIVYDNDPPGYGGADMGTVTTIRMVRGNPWLHVTQAGRDHEDNEVIYDHPTTKSGRHVTVHIPIDATEENDA